jgi:hypothetical protein
MNAPPRNALPIKRNIKGVGLTYSNLEQQLKDNPLFQRRVTANDERLAFVLPTKEQLCLELLRLPENDPHHIIVSCEAHQDGARHFHVYIQWLAPHSNVDTRYFDVWGMHPNIVQVINQDNWVKYIQKEDASPFIWVPIIFITDSDDEGIDQESE